MKLSEHPQHQYKILSRYLQYLSIPKEVTILDNLHLRPFISWISLHDMKLINQLPYRHDLLTGVKLCDNDATELIDLSKFPNISNISLECKNITNIDNLLLNKNLRYLHIYLAPKLLYIPNLDAFPNLTSLSLPTHITNEMGLPSYIRNISEAKEIIKQYNKQRLRMEKLNNYYNGDETI